MSILPWPAFIMGCIIGSFGIPFVLRWMDGSYSRNLAKIRNMYTRELEQAHTRELQKDALIAALVRGEVTPIRKPNKPGRKREEARG